MLELIAEQNGKRIPDMGAPDLKSEFEFYQANKAELLAKHAGKFIVIKERKVIGVYDDRLLAIDETKKTHAVGTFIVQHVSDKDPEVRFHTRFAL